MIQDSDMVPDVFGEWFCGKEWSARGGCEKMCSGNGAVRKCVRGGLLRECVFEEACLFRRVWQ